MQWPWPTPSRKDAVAVVLLIAVVAVVAFAAIKYPLGGRATGFGPDWDCTHVGQGDPVCVRKPAATSGNPESPAK